MKKTILILIALSTLLNSCTNLDLNPLSEGSSSNWYSNEEELTMSVRYLYADQFWVLDNNAYTDDWTARYELTAITNGTLDGTYGPIIDWWSNAYMCIAQANALLCKLDEAQANGVNENFIKRIEGEARFVRAVQYSRLVSHFGDVVLTLQPIDFLDDAFNKSRTAKAIIMDSIYSDFDKAIELLGTKYSGEVRATKGVVCAFKARAALYNKDYQIAAKAAQNCMDLNQYSLHPSFSDLFLISTTSSPEFIFIRPRNNSLKQSNFRSNHYISRLSGGWGNYNPSWDLWCSFLCVDGKPIDESPLFNPQEPFTNRDPRCTATIVAFETPHLGYIYNPNPYATTALNLSTSKNVPNQDNRAINQYASYNGLLLKKGVDIDWLKNSFLIDKTEIIMRYADVLLMYAEAKIELGEIDDSVLDAINSVRARAYNVDKTLTSAYPSVTTQNANELRRILRIERRMEFAFEGLRYMDLIRWNLAEKSLNTAIYGVLDPADLKTKVVDQGLWFFPEVPDIDEDGIANFSSMYNQGLIKELAQRSFDSTRQYLWPIPTKEILINDNLEQNPNY